MMSLEEIVKHVEQVAYSNNDKALICMGIKEYRQLAELLRELKERRKVPEIVRCGECVNFAERDFCKVAGHNVHRKSNCMKVFGAERRNDGKTT